MAKPKAAGKSPSRQIKPVDIQKVCGMPAGEAAALRDRNAQTRNDAVMTRPKGKGGGK